MANPMMLAYILGGWEVVLLVAVILLLLLGAKHLPEMARGLGDGISQFRKELDQEAHEAGKSLGGIYGKPAAEALTPDNHTAELYDAAVFHEESSTARATKRAWHRRWWRLWRLISRAVLKRLKPKN